MLKKRLIWVIGLLLAGGGALQAQTLQLKGVVLENNNDPVEGAYVYVKDNSTIYTFTDHDGRFELNVPEDTKVITVAFVGLKTTDAKLSKIDNLQKIKIRMKPDVEVDYLPEAMVAAFTGQTTIHQVTGSVSVVRGEEFKIKPISGIDALLEGEAAGVSIRAVTGQPGTRTKIRIRGTSNLSGNSEPLWVVDGVPMPDAPGLTGAQMAAGGLDDLFLTGVGNLNPGDIESVTILKDASAAAIYGSKAANGVIVVTTRSGYGGIENKPRLNYSNNLTWTLRPSRNANLMNSEEKLWWEQQLWDEFGAPAFANAATDPTAVYPVVGIVGQIRSGAGQFAGLSQAAQNAAIAQLASQSTDWYNVLLRNGFSHNHHLSLSGGDYKLSYYVSLGVTDEDGLLVNNSYQRYNLNGKLKMNPLKWLGLEMSVEGSRQRSLMPDSTVDPFTYAYFANPYERPYNADGTYAPDNTWFTLGYYNGRSGETVMPDRGFNILREMDLNRTESINSAASARFKADFRISTNLKATLLLNGSLGQKDSDKIVDKDSYTGFRDRLGNDDRSQTLLYGNITHNSTGSNSYLARGLVEYTLRRQAFTLQLMGGAEARASSSKTVYNKRYGYDPATGIATMPEPSGPMDQWLEQVKRLGGEYWSEVRYLSFFASADTYLLDETLVLNASVRSDGSSAFGLNRQFHPTWSAGAAWHILPYANGWLSHASLRSAFGYTGNINTDALHLLVLEYDLNHFRTVGGKQYNVGSIASAPNPNLGWERTRDFKLGVDAGFFDDRLSLNAEWYHRMSTDVVCPSQVLSTTGFTSVYFNSADILNTGVELSLNYGQAIDRDWHISAGGNFSYNYNKVTRYTPAYGSRITSRDRYVEGYPVGAVFAGECGGVDLSSGLYGFYFRSDASVSSPKDLNNPDNYRKYLGTIVAPYYGGLNLAVSYMRFRLSVNGVYSFGAVAFDKIVSPASYLDARHDGYYTVEVQSQYSDLYSNHLNVTRDRTDRWTENDRTARYPRIYDRFQPLSAAAIDNPVDSDIVDGIYLKDIAYLKVKNIVLSWSTQKLRWCRSLEVHASLGNFITLTPYDGVDPEVPGATYPTPRSASIGMNVTL